MTTSSAVEFNEFSFWDDDRGYRTITKEERNALGRYLESHFDCTDYMTCGPFLVLFCGTLPAEHFRPFTIADCVTVWVQEDDAALPAELSLGDSASGPGIEIDEAAAKELRPYRLASIAAMGAVAKSFPLAEYITFYTTGIIVELREKSPEEYQEALEQLPNGLDNCVITLYYNNGPLASTEMARTIKTNPRFIDGQVDDTNYVKSQDCFFPGVMLSARNGNSISAGVLLSKADKKRLTVAFHCFDEEYDEHPDKLGDPQYFKVTQGNLTNGAEIDNVVERLGGSDIGFAKLHPGIEFYNRFINIGAEAKVLLPFTSIRFADEFHTEGYLSSQQTLKCLGIRGKVNEKRETDVQVPPDAEQPLPPPARYFSFHQGIYATSAPIVMSKSLIRAGACGSAIVRSKSFAKGNVLSKGEIAGFMQYSDLRPKSLAEGQLLCFGGTLDELIEEGWEIATATGKRKVEDEDELDEEASPRKSTRT
ncbi:MAG: hypothetical protein Q9170_002350 [Blastenia crenularia]